MESKSFKLRHSLQPYGGFVVIYAALAIFFVIASVTTNNWKDSVPLLSFLTAAFVILVVFWAFLNSRYRVALEDGTLVMQSASLFNKSRALTSIKIADITSVKKEISDTHSAIKLRRPFRRIAIYAGQGDGAKWIDVSLKHFKLEDIRKLLRGIRDSRPDLDVPEV
jgi:hypothetical protein